MGVNWSRNIVTACLFVPLTYLLTYADSDATRMNTINTNLASISSDSCIRTFGHRQSDAAKTSPGIHRVPTRLLQFAPVRRIQLHAAKGTIRTECRRTSDYWNRIAPVQQKLHWLPVRRRVEFKLACLVHQSLAGQTP